MGIVRIAVEPAVIRPLGPAAMWLPKQNQNSFNEKSRGRWDGCSVDQSARRGRQYETEKRLLGANVFEKCFILPPTMDT